MSAYRNWVGQYGNAGSYAASQAIREISSTHQWLPQISQQLYQDGNAGAAMALDDIHRQNVNTALQQSMISSPMGSAQSMAVPQGLARGGKTRNFARKRRTWK
jgi:hypothetical protein